jgi:thymidylate synthase ThyX
MFKFFEGKFPREKGTDEKIYNSRIRNKVFDNCRYMLPVATQTNLGMTVNARQLEYAIIKMLSHPLEEIQQIGEEIKKAALKIIPTLVKNASRDEYIFETAKNLSKISKKYLGKVKIDKEQPVTLVKYNKDAEEKVITALLYKFSNLPYAKVQSSFRKMTKKDKEKIIDATLKKYQRKDQPPRELEHAYYTFDILMDYGAFRDVQRHRMNTQTNQFATTEHGYSTPDGIVEAGFKEQYDAVMQKAADTFKILSKRFPIAAQYAVPLAYKKRTLITMNLREVYHFVRLRTGPAGHISYRRIAQEVYRQVKKVHPLLAKYIMVNLD